MESTQSTREHESPAGGEANDSLRFHAKAAFPAVVGVFVATASWSWGKWSDPIVDFGRELYTPWQLSQNKSLSIGEGAIDNTSSIVTLFGPFSQYFNATWFRVLGDGAWTLYSVNLVLAFLAVGMVFVLFRRLTDELTALAVCVVQILVFTFSQYFVVSGYNFIAPYAHEAVHGLLLLVTGVLFWQEFLTRESPRWLAGSGVCFGLALLTKLEPALSSVACSVAIVFWLGLVKFRAGSRSLNISIFIAAFCTAPICCIGLLSAQMPLEQALRVTVGAFAGLKHPEVAELAFYKKISGFDTPLARLNDIIAVAIILLVALAILYLFNRYLRRQIRSQKPGGQRLLVIVGVAAVFFLRGYINWEQVARVLPVIAGGVFAWSTIVGCRKLLSIIVASEDSPGPSEASDRARLLTLNLWAVLAMTSLLKTLLWSRLLHYGFTLSLPAALMCVAIVCYWLPKRLGTTQTVSLIRGLCAGLVFVGAFSLWERANMIYSRKTTQISTATEKLLVLDAQTDPRSEVLQPLLNYLEDNADEEETLAVFPEGISINFYLRMENPSPYINLMPPELLIFDDKEILSALKSSPPDWIVLWPKDVKEYGVEPFGSPGYGEGLLGWTRSHYKQKHVVHGLKEGPVEVLKLSSD